MTHECIICYGPITMICNRGLKQICCGNWYHYSCINKWYQAHNTCPTCDALKTKMFITRKYNISFNDLIYMDIYDSKTKRKVCTVSYNDVVVQVGESMGRITLELPGWNTRYIIEDTPATVTKIRSSIIARKSENDYM